MGDRIRQDVRYALRALRRSPGFSAVAILSLALGIGVNTTIFTFVNAVLLRPLPYPESHRIVVLRERQLGAEGTVNVHPFNFLAWQARARSFDALALVQTPPLNVMSADGAEQIYRVQTTPELFRVFDVSPMLGRAFTDEDMRPGQRAIVVLGHGFWRRWFGGDPGIVGRTLPLANGSLTIVGVAPPGLRIGSREPEAYTPLAIDPANPAAVGSRSFQCYGRLKPGTDVAMARADMTLVASDLARQFPLDRGYGVFVARLQDYLVGDTRRALWLLMGVVVIVLLIACANLGGLLMARGMNRQGELAVRASLGASRGRLIAQLTVESVVIALCGGAAGLLVAYWSTRALAALAANTLASATPEPIRMDTTCLLFTLAVSSATALVFGFLPAWEGSRTDPDRALRRQRRGATADRRQHTMRRLLVASEVALAVVLLVGAGLLLRTFSNLVRVDLGFQPARTITMGLFLGVRPPEERVAVLDRILDRVEALPGVAAAGTIQFLPLSGANCGTGFRREGEPPGDPATALPTECSLIGRDYFRAMGIPLIAGRAFDRRDRLTGPRAVIVNQSFAKRYFPGAAAVGRRIVVDWSDVVPAEIVGIVGDVRHNGLTAEPAPTVFLLHEQTPGYITNLVVRTTRGVGVEASAVRRAIQEVERTQAVSSASTMEQYVDDALARPRLYAALIAGFSVLAVALAAIGVYGLLAYVVAQRAHEIGIRLALGATRARIFLGLFGVGARLIASGLAAGVVAAIGLRRLISTFLFGVTPGDPASYAIAAVAFSIVALAAVAIPAGRAARADPTGALRSE